MSNYKNQFTAKGVYFPTISSLDILNSDYEDEIYFIRMKGTNYYKIGVSNDVDKRIKALQTGNPVKLEIYTTYRVNYAGKAEKFIHKLLRDYQREGEWFEITEKMIDSIIISMEGDATVNTGKDCGDFKVIGSINNSPGSSAKIVYDPIGYSIEDDGSICMSPTCVTHSELLYYINMMIVDLLKIRKKINNGKIDSGLNWKNNVKKRCEAVEV